MLLAGWKDVGRELIGQEAVGTFYLHCCNRHFPPPDYVANELRWVQLNDALSFQLKNCTVLPKTPALTPPYLPELVNLQPSLSQKPFSPFAGVPHA